MACEKINMSTSELLNYLKNKIPFFTITAADTQEDIIARLDFIQEKFGVGKESQKYELLETGDIAVSGRVSDANKRKFENALGKKKAEEINNHPDNQTKAEAGTFIHLVAQHITNAVLAGEGINSVRKEFTSNKYPQKLSVENFNKIEKGVKAIIEQIKEKQEEINRKNGTTGTVQIRTEQIVIDPRKDVGGSIDLLAVYSDGTASVFDYKSMMPASRYKKKGTTEIIEEFIPFYKVDSFKLQQSQYKRILQDRLGIKAVRQTRIVPIQMELEPIPGISKTKKYTKKIKEIKMGEDSEFLDQLTLGFEDTGYAGINELVQKTLSKIENLRAKQKEKGLRKGEWKYLQDRIDALNKSMSSIILKGDFTDFYSHIVSSIKTFRAHQGQEQFLEDGSPNPSYLSEDELHDLLSEFGLYRNNVKLTLQFLRDLKGKDNKEYKKLQGLIDKNSPYIDRTYAEIEEMLATRGLEEIDDKYKDEYGNLLPMKDEGFWNKWTGGLADFANPIFKKFRELKDKALNNKRISMKRLVSEVEEKQMALFKWAKANGLSKQQAYDLIINKKTGNLISQLNEEFWKLNNEAFDEGKLGWIKKHYEIRNIDQYKKWYNERLKSVQETLKAKHHNLEDWVQEGEVIRTAAYHKKAYQMDLKKWKQENDLINNKEAWKLRKNRKYLNLKEGVREKYYTKEYKDIMNNKPVIEFYNMFVEYNKQFREMLGVQYYKLPNNFLPNIRKDIVEKLTDNSFNAAANAKNSLSEMLESLSIREEDNYMAHTDPETGEVLKNIPLLFLNRFKDADGNDITSTEKTYDLGRSLILFGNMAYNNKFMTEIEGQVYALQQTLINSKQTITSASGKEGRDSNFNKIVSDILPTSDMVKMFDKFVDYYLYGIKYSEPDKTYKVLGKELSVKQTVLKAKEYFALKTLGIPIIPGAAAFLHGRVGLAVEKRKGISFTKDQWANTWKLHLNDSKKYHALSYFFETHTEDFVYREALDKSASNMVEWVNSRTMFAPLRKADENIDSFLTVAMAQNYGVDKNGNIKRLENLPEGTKSLWESTSYKDGKIKIDGLTESAFIGFRNAVRETSIKIKGTRSADDVTQMDMNLALSVAMQFKTWMPGIIKERSGKLRYNEILDSVDMGRYRAMFSEYANVNELDLLTAQGWMQYMGSTFLPNLAKISIDIATFGMLPENLIKPVNEERAKLYYQKWAAENPVEAKDVTYEQFLKVKQSQIKAFANEVRMILILHTLLAGLANAAGDDDELNYRQYWIGRNLYRLMHKWESELLFAMNPEEAMRLLRNPIPILKLFTDIYNVFFNTLDESRDLLFGENVPTDKSGIGHYSSTMVLGFSQLRRVFDFIWEEDKRRKY